MTDHHTPDDGNPVEALGLLPRKQPVRPAPGPVGASQEQLIAAAQALLWDAMGSFRADREISRAARLEIIIGHLQDMRAELSVPLPPPPEEDTP